MCAAYTSGYYKYSSISSSTVTLFICFSPGRLDSRSPPLSLPFVITAFLIVSYHPLSEINLINLLVIINLKLMARQLLLNKSNCLILLWRSQMRFNTRRNALKASNFDCDLHVFYQWDVPIAMLSIITQLFFNATYMGHFKKVNPRDASDLWRFAGQ